MKAICKPKLDCISCMDLGWYTIECCAYCMKINTREVDILELGVGLFGNKAVIKDSSGKLMTVSLEELTLIGFWEE